MRKFEQVRDDAMQYNKNPIKKPMRATKFSAGYDIYSPIDEVLNPGEAKMIWTNLKAQMPADEYLLLCTTSGMGKKGIRLANGIGIIDSDYYENESNDGNFAFRLVNFSAVPYEIKVGDKIGQGIFMKYQITDDDIESTETRKGGFGSTVK